MVTVAIAATVIVCISPNAVVAISNIADMVLMSTERVKDTRLRSRIFRPCYFTAAL